MNAPDDTYHMHCFMLFLLVCLSILMKENIDTS